jgi:surfactin synthase thioesterase subunit
MFFLVSASCAHVLRNSATTRDHTIAALARRILAHAPPRFALAGLSMGGYVCFEITRQAPTGWRGWPCWTPRLAPTPPR